MTEYTTRFPLQVIVIGSGFAGAAAAHVLREQMGSTVTVLEGSAHAGGMLRTLYTQDGLPYEYGPRVLSVFRGTQSGLDFVKRLVELEKRDIYQGTQLRPGYPVVPFPLDRESLDNIPEGAKIRREMEQLKNGIPDESNLRTYLETSVGPTLTQLAFTGFNRKFWGRELEELPASWGKLRRLERIAEKGSYRLPSMASHYYPKGGFNPLFDKLLDGIDVRYKTKVNKVVASPAGSTVYCNQEKLQADLVISTAPID